MRKRVDMRRHRYSTADIDIMLYCCRKWVQATGMIPDSLWGAIQNMTDEDQRLSAYLHMRILRNPTLKRVMVQMQSFPDGDCDSAGCDPKILKMPMQIRQDRMFH
jgi:hypothetical protein